MKKILITTLILLSALTARAQETKQVLFIGNSYTEVNDLPQLVQRVAESAGQRIEYGSNTPGGCTFQQHCTNQSMTLIQRGGWDVVVLQEQSQLPSFPEGQVTVECLPYAARLVDSVYAHNPDGEAMFYMTWGRKYGDQQNARYFAVLGTYEGMDSMLYTRYMRMARDNDASVCPVGRVWRYLRSTYNDAIELYQSDESHPSMAGSYAAACSFYTMIFHRSPLDITYHPAEVEEGDAETIRQAVDTIVWQNLSYWLRQADTVPDTTHQDTTHTDTTHTDTTHVGICDLSATMLDCRLYPNPAGNALTVTVNDITTPCEAAIYDLRGRRIRVLTLRPGSTTLDIADLPAGIYTLRVATSTRTGITRFIKQ